MISCIVGRSKTPHIMLLKLEIVFVFVICTCTDKLNRKRHPGGTLVLQLFTRPVLVVYSDPLYCSTTVAEAIKTQIKIIYEYAVRIRVQSDQLDKLI